MSLKPNPVRWFEIAVSDLPRATRFYEQAFGISMHPLEMGPSKLSFFPMERGAMGIAGSLVLTPGINPSLHGTTVYIGVDSIDPVLAQIQKAGGMTLLARQGIGQYGFIAHFEDSEGNRVGLHEMPAEAG